MININSKKSIDPQYKHLYKSGVKRCKIQHLSKNSHIKVPVICSKCGKTYEKEYRHVYGKEFICRSCFAPDIKNKVYGYWTILNEPHQYRNNQIYLKCRCKCGTERYVQKQSIIQGKSLSCGCYRTEKSKERIELYNKKLGRDNQNKVHWYNQFKWRNTRKKFIKDKCVNCGTDENLVLHHIYCARYYPNLRYTEENLITLCEKCHMKYHSMTNISHLYLFEEWLKKEVE